MPQLQGLDLACGSVFEHPSLDNGTSSKQLHCALHMRVWTSRCAGQSWSFLPLRKVGKLFFQARWSGHVAGDRPWSPGLLCLAGQLH